MRKVTLAFTLAILFGIFTYLLLSNSNFRLMSLDDQVASLSAQLETHILPDSLKGKDFADKRIEMEYKAICSGLSLGFLVWAILFVLHRIQIFIVDFSAFLPLKK